MFTKPTDHTAAALVDQAAQSAEEVIASTRSLANHAMDGLSGSVENLRGVAAPALDHLAEQAGAMTKHGVEAVLKQSLRATDRARQAGTDTLHYIEREPVKALLMAAAAGAALMALFTRRSSRHDPR